MPHKPNGRINLDEPRWDQSQYWGRANYFFATTNPLNLLKSSEELERAKDIVIQYKRGENVNMSEDEIWHVKQVYDSAFHPETGEKLILIGRMSAQVPMNMFITGCMMSFYKSSKEVIFWQWFNQSFNAVVNYSNRSGTSPIRVTQLATSYVLATGGALATALGLNSMVKKAPPLIGRFVPFAAVAAANCVNIPMMRMGELQNGIPVFDEHGKEVGISKTAARVGITTVVFSRIAMAVPGMIIPPIMMNYAEKKGYWKKYSCAGTPFQIILCGILLTFATPMCCALFPQKASMAATSLEPELQDRVKRMSNPPKYVYYNKGL